MTIGKFAEQCLRAGKSAKETLAMVKKVFPECKTTMKCVYYYASKAGIKLTKSAVVDQKQLEAALKQLKAA